MLRRIAEARKGNYSYKSAPRERVRLRTLCPKACLYVRPDNFIKDFNVTIDITTML